MAVVADEPVMIFGLPEGAGALEDLAGLFFDVNDFHECSTLSNEWPGFVSIMTWTWLGMMHHAIKS